MKLVHVGFGKTATTSLQRVVFPELCRNLGFTYVGSQDNRIKKHRALLELGKTPLLNSDFKNSLISSEGLCSWDPYFWDEWAVKNSEFFGRDAHVLLVLREPESYLKSVYIQRCFHEGNVMPAKNYFLDRKRYSPYLSSAKFSVEDFSYKKIIDAYVTRFDRVTVAKYEDLGSLSALKQIFDMRGLHYTGWNYLSYEFSKHRSNPSYNNVAINLTLGIQKLLRIIGFSLSPGEISSAQGYLETLSTNVDGYSLQNKKENNGLFKNYCLRVVRVLTWRSLMTKVVSFFPNQKFILDSGKIRGLDIEVLKNEYQGIPSVHHFIKGCAVNE